MSTPQGTANVNEELRRIAMMANDMKDEIAGLKTEPQTATPVTPSTTNYQSTTTNITNIMGGSGFSGGGQSGLSGYSGKSGYSGYSGFSGSGLSGYSGFSSYSGYSGYSGKCGQGTSSSNAWFFKLKEDFTSYCAFTAPLSVTKKIYPFSTMSKFPQSSIDNYNNSALCYLFQKQLEADNIYNPNIPLEAGETLWLQYRASDNGSNFINRAWIDRESTTFPPSIIELQEPLPAMFLFPKDIPLDTLRSNLYSLFYTTSARNDNKLKSTTAKLGFRIWAWNQNGPSGYTNYSGGFSGFPGGYSGFSGLTFPTADEFTDSNVQTNCAHHLFTILEPDTGKSIGHEVRTDFGIFPSYNDLFMWFASYSVDQCLAYQLAPWEELLIEVVGFGLKDDICDFIIENVAGEYTQTNQVDKYTSMPWTLSGIAWGGLDFYSVPCDAHIHIPEDVTATGLSITHMGIHVDTGALGEHLAYSSTPRRTQLLRFKDYLGSCSAVISMENEIPIPMPIKYEASKIDVQADPYLSPYYKEYLSTLDGEAIELNSFTNVYSKCLIDEEYNLQVSDFGKIRNPRYIYREDISPVSQTGPFAFELLFPSNGILKLPFDGYYHVHVYVSVMEEQTTGVPKNTANVQTLTVQAGYLGSVQKTICTSPWFVNLVGADGKFVNTSLQGSLIVELMPLSEPSSCQLRYLKIGVDLPNTDANYLSKITDGYIHVEYIGKQLMAWPSCPP